MIKKKLSMALLAVGMLSVSVMSAGNDFIARAEEVDTADKSFLEYVSADTNSEGKIKYSHSPLYNEKLMASGRQYNFSIGKVNGYALLTEIRSENKIFYEVEELFYDKLSPFEASEGLPVYITFGVYLDYKDNAFYNIIDNSLVTVDEIETLAYKGFGYCGAWEFEERDETVSYASKNISEYSIQYDLPNYYGAPNGTTCASIAGTVLLGYYDRFYEELIPNFQVYTRLGTRIKYKSLSDVILNLSNELYNLMGGEREHIGTTYSEFQDGMSTYIESKGHTYITTSVFSWGEFDFNKYKMAVESNKPVVLFLSRFAIKNYIVQDGTVDTIKNDFAETPHVVVGCGYEQYQYFDSTGKEIDNRIYLKVATGLTDYLLSYININGLTSIDRAISVEIN